jgi:hypothetical protein
VIEYVIAGVVVLAAVVLAARRLYRSATGKGGCGSCSSRHEYPWRQDEPGE